MMIDFEDVEDYTLMVFELLHCDLASAMKTKFHGSMELKQVASIGLQLCHALCNMQKVVFNYPTTVVHNDIKTDNIMFTDSSYSEIKIVDFGFASLENEKVGEMIQFVVSHSINITGTTG